MFQKLWWIVNWVALSLLVAPASAHPGHTHEGSAGKANAPRNWRDGQGNVLVQGSFGAVQGELVQIRQGDESLVTLKLAQLSEANQLWVANRLDQIRLANVPPAAAASLDQLPPFILAQQQQPPPEMARAFAAFVEAKAIKTRWDEKFFYVESRGIPLTHRMMVGITAWQQQVPLPQNYAGENAWQIPLHPVPAKAPQSTKNNFLRGAIALAANGVPIFNPLNNRGDDAFLFGELDEFGGHCGRADDYHYHIAPVHLQKLVGQGLPIAYALDGYPIYGYEEPDGSPVKGLDALNGHQDAAGNYHYHSTKKYPYLNGGFHGEVTQRGGQVDPQPRAEPLRPDLRPLRDAKITDFKEPKPGSYELTYDVKGKPGSVRYRVGENGQVDFTFVDPSGKTTSETYQARKRGPGGAERPPPPPRRTEAAPAEKLRVKVAAKPASKLPQLVITSSAVDAKGILAADFTCDGTSASPPLEWQGAPEGTKSFALCMWHIAPDKEKSYWILYNIPANVTKLAKNSHKIGTPGQNDKRRTEYDPPCSKGPGLKQYHITLYALSAELKLKPDEANLAAVRKAVEKLTLAEATLDFSYERKK